MKITFALLAAASLALWNGAGLAAGAQVEVWRVLLAVALGVAAYLLGRRANGPRDHLVLWAVPVLSVPFAFVAAWDWAAGLLVYACTIVLPWFAGRFRRQQRALIEAGRERVAALERERNLVAAEARRRERERIAADMHDSLGHELALIALRAGILELTPGLRPEQLTAVGELRVAAGNATEQLRRTIGLLREDAEPELAPAGEGVEELIARAAAAGMDVALVRAGGGEAVLDRDGERALHRVVQEALTNAAKHAPGAAVRVEVEAGDGVRAAIRNGLSAVGGSGSGSGLGLIGLAERVRLAGGTFVAGAEGTEFVVRAEFPGEDVER